MQQVLFDKENRQYEHQYIARDLKGNLVAGWVVIDQPWNTNETEWTYWMYYNQYGETKTGNFRDYGLNRVEVNPDTIKRYTNIEKIKLLLSKGEIVELVKKWKNPDSGKILKEQLAIIRKESDIPYKLWER